MTVGGGVAFHPGRVVRDRSTTLDAARGLAAILVVLRHVTFLAPTRFAESFLAVDLFFVLSGVVLCSSYETRLIQGLPWQRFLTLRVIRLYPLYLLGCAFGLLALAFVPAPFPGPVSLMVAMAVVMMPLPSAGMYPLDAPAWSLLLELIANLVYSICARSGTPAFLLTIMTIAGLGLAATCLVWPDHSLDVGWTMGSLPAGLMRVAFSFSVGILLRHLLDRIEPTTLGPVARTSIAWGLLGIVALVLTAEPSAAGRPVFELAAVGLVFPMLVFAMLLYEPEGRSRHLFAKLGAISYPVYVLHVPLAQIADGVGADIGVPLHDFAPWSGIGFLALLVLICEGLDKLFDKPIRRRLIAYSELRASIGARLA